MTTGALIFAYNNDTFDYVRMAAWSADNIRRHLDIPVAVVTDKPTDLGFDQVIIHACETDHSRWFGDINRRVTWNNLSRPDAWNLSPWDRTLMLDADYVVASDQLACLLHRQDLLCHRWARDAVGMDGFWNLNHFGKHDLPMYWATVIAFSRDKQAQRVFDCMKMIRDNWSHYKNIYQDPAKNYRNDHSLSIALNIVAGHWSRMDSIPWDLVTVLPEHRLRLIDTDCYRVDYRADDGRACWLEIIQQDFHAMGKQQLMSLIS